MLTYSSPFLYSPIQPLSDRDPPVPEEEIQTARVPSPFAGIRPGTAARQRLNKLQYIQAITEPTAVGIEEVCESSEKNCGRDGDTVNSA